MSGDDNSARGLSFGLRPLRRPQLDARGTGVAPELDELKLIQPELGSHLARGTTNRLSGELPSLGAHTEWRIQQQLGVPRTLYKPQKPPELNKPEFAQGAAAERMLQNKEAIRRVMSLRSDPIAHVPEKPALALSVGMQETSDLSSNYPFGDVYPIPTPEFKQGTFSSRGISKASAAKLADFQLKLPPGWGDPNAAVQTLTAFGDLQKRGDAANYGLFKMNWYMIKQTETGQRLINSAARLVNSGQAEPSADAEIQSIVGRQINGDTTLATAVLRDAMDMWSMKAPDPSAPERDNFWAGHRMGQSGLEGAPGIDWHDVRRYYDSVQKIFSKVKADPSIWKDNRREGVTLINK